MTPEAEARAKELFFDFDGSEFYMSRDGADQEFAAFGVPPDKRREWMRELTARHLAALDMPGKWKTLHFLSHHSDYSHVARVLAARPLGVWWEQVAFLEELLRYVRAARWTLRTSGRDLAHAAETALAFGGPLLAKTVDLDKRRRVESLLQNARSWATWRI